MKKIVSLALSAAIGISALGTSAFAEKSTTNAADSLVVFGDSISTGYTRSGYVEHNYAEICADYLGYDFDNFAVNGADTADLIKLLETDTEATMKAAEAEVIVVSIGGNDVINYVSKVLITFAATNGFLNEGYTINNIPEKPSILHMKEMINLNAMLSHFKSKPIEAVTVLNEITANLCYSNEKYEGYIPNVILPNMTEIRDTLQEINPNAEIVFQTVYQPLQFSPEYFEAAFGDNAGTEYAGYADMIDQLRLNFKKIMDVFSTNVKAIENVNVADVYYDFTSVAPSVYQGISNQGNAHYFTDIQLSGEARDLHPNQKGHLAIAVSVLEQLGGLHSDTGLLSEIYNGLEDKNQYPAIALEKYFTVAGKEPIQVTTTTTSPTPVVTTTTTTSPTPVVTTTTTTSPTPVGTTTTTTNPNPIEPTIKLADVNGDGVINPIDATIVLREYANTSTGGNSDLSAEQFAAADVNKDGKLNPIDSTIILQYYSYKSTGGTGEFEDFIG